MLIFRTYLIGLFAILLFFNFKMYGVYFVSVYLYFGVFFLRSVSKIWLAAIAVTTISVLSGAFFSGSLAALKYHITFLQIFISYAVFLRYFKAIGVDEMLNKFSIFLIVYTISALSELNTGRFLWFESRNWEIYLPRINAGFRDSNSYAAFLFLSLICTVYLRRIWLQRFVRFSLFSNVVATFSRAALAVSSLLALYYLSKKKIVFLVGMVVVALGVFQTFSFSDSNILVNRFTDFKIDSGRLNGYSLAGSQANFFNDHEKLLLTPDPHNSLILVAWIYGGWFVILFLVAIFILLFDKRNIVGSTFIFSLVVLFNFFNSDFFNISSTITYGLLFALVKRQRTLGADLT